jgi:hypothetical protein
MGIKGSRQSQSKKTTIAPPSPSSRRSPPSSEAAAATERELSFADGIGRTRSEIIGESSQIKADGTDIGGTGAAEKRGDANHTFRWRRPAGQRTAERLPAARRQCVGRSKAALGQRRTGTRERGSTKHQGRGERCGSSHTQLQSPKRAPNPPRCHTRCSQARHAVPWLWL